MDEAFCNDCWQEVSGKVFQLSCGHIFCEGCANRGACFSGRCSFCRKDFSSKDLLEVQLAGARIHEADMRELRSMLYAVGFANGVPAVEELSRQIRDTDVEQLRGKFSFWPPAGNMAFLHIVD